MMTNILTRRRFLIAAAVSGVATALPAKALRWQGTALGAKVQILMDHPEATRLTQIARAEITRLERIFSLYDASSELSRLNRDGKLEAPSFELLSCLTLARHAFNVTEGRFDPTVQSVWSTQAEALAAGRRPSREALEDARARVGFDRVSFDPAMVRLGHRQALTLNGIAQGVIADRVSKTLKDEGLADVLVDTGEIAARGFAKNQAGWPVTIAQTKQRLILRDRALATSHTYGTVLDPDGRLGHILNPLPGASVARRQVSVSADSAGLADALSTGLSLVSDAATAGRLLTEVRSARLEAYVVDPPMT